MTLMERMVTSRHERTPDDDRTPGCVCCGSAHVGIFNSAYVMLQGQWCINPELGAEMFVLSPDVNVEFFNLPNGQRAMVLEVNKKKPAAACIHEECLDTAVSTMRFYGVEDEIDDEADDEVFTTHP